MKFFAMLLSLLFCIMFCMDAGALDQDKIIGDNDLVLVNADASNIPLKYKNLVNAFGLLSTGCTATHIGKGYVLTAGHCFWAGNDLAVDLPCDDTTVEWGLREGISPYMKSTCQRIIAKQKNSINDFAIIKVFPVPDVSVGIELQRKASVNDRITIFSHPELLTLHWSKICSVESDADFSKNFLQHKCDTKPGSSGASILDATTKRIVAIHDGGIAFAPQFLWVITGGPPTGMNYGTYLTNHEISDTLRKLGF